MRSRFSILFHQTGPALNKPNHWDLFLQPPDGTPPFPSLISFACYAAPNSWQIGTAFDSLPPHREEYLEYEGPISGDRGEVRMVEFGDLFWLDLTPERIEFLLTPFGATHSRAYSLEPRILADPNLTGTEIHSAWILTKASSSPSP